jgi:hypothetical protein
MAEQEEDMKCKRNLLDNGQERSRVLLIIV